jgi:N6-adenosine-specific RNA methylase IME4
MKLINFPNKTYSIIYIDPPWPLKRGPDWNSNGPSKPLPYPTLSLDEIKNIPIKTITNKDEHLYLWVVNKYIKNAYDIVENWGFKSSCLLTWCKPRHGIGIGGTYIQTTEHLLFCRKGSLKAKKRIDSTWFEHKRLSHSTKPNFFREMIVNVSGDLPKIELFARNEFEGWDVWGNEINNEKVIY